MTTLKSDSEFYLAEERGSQASEEIVLKECNLSELDDFYVNSESLEYAIITLLKCFDRYNEGNTTPTRFNKLMYILNDELVKEDIDINLPYFWYLYGPVIPLNFLPEGLIKLLEKPWGRGIKISEHRRNDLPENIKTKIDIKAREIYDIYCRVDPRIMTGKVINDAYKKAPYVFQSKYKLFQRQITRKIRDKDILLRLGPLKMERNIRDLNELAKVFNRTDFPEVYSDLLQWKLLVNYQLKELLSIEGSLLVSLLDSYWYIFCQVLKIKCNNNLPSRLVMKWNNKLPGDIKEYRIKFMQMEDKFYSEMYMPKKPLEEDLYNAYNETVIKRLLE